MFVICCGTFKTGYINRFPSPNAAYGYYCGKVLGKILDIFCTVSIALSTLIMFAGSGATVNQYLGSARLGGHARHGRCDLWSWCASALRR